MTTATSVESRNIGSPDEVRPFVDKGRSEIVTIAGRDVGRGTFEPGWRWSEHVKPIAQTESCQVAHFGICLSGSMTVRMEDGTETTMREGDIVTIPPGHDAWVDGDEACVFVDFGEIGGYAKPH